MIILWGSNARETHPIFFHHLLRGVRSGARLVAVDPRRTSSAEWADVWLGIDVGSDISLANAMAREIIHNQLADKEFIARATTGYDEFARCVEAYTLDRAEADTGVPAAAIKEVALAYADQRRIISAMEKTIDPRRHLSNDPVVLTSIPGVRRYLRQVRHRLGDCGVSGPAD